MIIKKILILSLAIFFIAPAFAIEEANLFIPREVKDGSILSIEDCVALAFQNSPKIRQKKYELDLAKSNVGIAKSRYFPIIGAGIGFYNENNSDKIYYNSHYRELPNIGISINKLVWDFGKTTSYIKMEEFYKIGAEYEFIDSLCATLFDVKEKYYKLLQAEALASVAKKEMEINENILKISKKNPDKNNAEINLNESKIKLIESQNNYLNTKLDLDNSMYLSSSPEYTIHPTNSYKYTNYEIFTPQTFPFMKENAIELAYQNSPDLKVLVSTQKAMEESLAYVKKTYLPELNTGAGYGYNNSTQVSNNSFQVGVNLSSSVNLMELKHSIKGANAQLNMAEEQVELFKKDLYFEVKRALNNVEKTENKIPIILKRINQSEENLKLVESLYKKGELNYISLQDAKEDYINSLKDYIQGLYDYNMALIQTEMAMHCHIVDIHHKSEHAIEYHSEELIEQLNKVLNCTEKETHNKKSKKTPNL